jgi:hypothetical protein
MPLPLLCYIFLIPIFPSSPFLLQPSVPLPILLYILFIPISLLILFSSTTSS